jgi:hypothetical protein
MPVGWPRFDTVTGEISPIQGRSISPDGKYLLGVKTGQFGSDLMLVEGFR